MATEPVVVTPIPAFPALSDRADGTYNSKAFAWAAHMGDTFVPQVNAAVGAMSSFAAGGAYAFQYAFDSATSDADPGAGKLRLGSATQNTATVLRIDNSMSGGADLTAVWADLLSVASSVKGSLRIVNATDVSKWMVLDVTGSTAATGYRNLAVSVRASSEENPFANNDALMVYIQRAGDVSSGAQIKIAEATVSSPVALVNFLSVFRADCNKYVIEIEGMTPSATSNSLYLRLAVGGAAQSGASYFAGLPGSTMTAASQFILTGSLAPSSGQNMALTVEIRNANANANKSISARGSSGSSNGGLGQEGYFSTNSPATGFQLFFLTENVTAGKVRVYGILN